MGSNKNTWSSEEDLILKQYYKELEYKKIGELLGRTTSSIKARSLKLGITKGRYQTGIEQKELEELYKNHTQQEISDKLGKTLHSIVYCLGKWGIEKKNFVKPHSYSVDQNFFTPLTEVSCAFAGLIASDGTIEKNRRRLSVILHARDRKFLEEWAYEIRYTGPIRQYTQFSRFSPPDGTPMVALTLNNVPEYVSCLETTFNVTRNKTKLLLPPHLTEQNLIKAYLIGLIDGDGHISKHNKSLRLGFCGTLAMCEWFKKQVSQIYGIHNEHRYLINRGNCWSYEINGPNARSILLDLKQSKVPKLERKWSKVI
jgi:hypothetical protein